MTNEVKKIEISTNVIWKTILILLSLWLLFLIRDVLLVLFLAIVIVSAAQPFVERMEKKKIPRVASAIVLYLTFFVFLGTALYLIIPIVSRELKQLGEDFPLYFEAMRLFIENILQIAATYNFENDLQHLIQNTTTQITGLLSGIFSNSFQFLLGIFKFVLVLSLSFYMLVKKNGTQGFLEYLVPKKHQGYAMGLVERIQAKIGRWMLGQATLMSIIFVFDYLALSLLGVPFALILALIGGLLEIIPYIGPMMALIPAVLAALTISPLTAVFVVIAYVAIQQIENHLVTPMIMRTAVGLNPVVIILVLLIGGTLAGVPGVILAVPFATAADVFISDIIDKKNVI